ncbi:MAG: NAD(P)-dependent oxidoreductase [Chloroflexota bacterium]|nr:NAD(P)-dependent oxidoreductase [Chloroflexota bacterium]
MQIASAALEKYAAEGKRIRVGMAGAGFMARGIANQIINSVHGIELVAIANRTLAKAADAYAYAGVENVVTVDSVTALEAAIDQHRPAVTDNAHLLCEADNIDLVLDITGALEFGAHLTMKAIECGKDMVSMNAELDGTVGPLLKVYAERAGVIFSGSDGDQPGVEMNVYRFVKGLGLTPLLCGNIKGLQDPYRNPTTQKGFAEKWGQNPSMVTSFADGTKISYEQALVANATGMRVAKRGMLGYNHDGHIDELTKRYDIDMLKSHGGIVDYVVGSKPSPGVFVLATHDDPKQRHYLNLYKLGEGPLYSFYQPYHLCHFEVPLSIARVALLEDYVITPLGAPVVEVITTAKIDLKAGDELDYLGGYTMYGEAENSDVVQRERLLPIGLAEGCRVKRDLPKDTHLTFDDVEIPAGRLIDKLYAEQQAHFATALA